ncbi:MAG TPA: fumarate/nitrate reduction transcriptional regulator Fnr [Gammaproteobacteria bacterium]|nr:fumarate/nitrate reduction transcriptional regulator Fnr [Gammaproteobacteria bacterium]
MPKVIDFSRIRASCASCNLQELCLPRGLHRKDLELLGRLVEQSDPLQQGAFLFRAGDPFRHLYAVRTGVIKLYLTTAAGDEQIIGFYFPGEILGLDAIDDRKHTCSAIALETSSCCKFSFDSLDKLCQSVDGLNAQMMRLMSRELSNENQLLLTLSKKNAEEKLATFLVTLSDRFRRLGYSATEFRLSMSRQDIGNYLGLTLETVSRVLNKFGRDRLISLDQKLVIIRQPEKLMKLAACSEGSPDNLTRQRIS